MDKKSSYSVAVFGFNQTERIVLGSIFGLSARRSPQFIQHNLAVGNPPDIYLVDASDAAAIEQLKKANDARHVPAILIGDWDHGTGWPVLARPIQWTRLFKAFDLATTLPDADRTQPIVLPQAATAVAAPSPVMRASVAPGVATPPPRPGVAPAPVARQPAPAVADISRNMPRANVAPTVTVQTSTIAPPAAPAAPVKEADWVLVCDDNLTVREFMKSKLAPFNFNVDYAESGEQAIGLTGKRFYTCVFLDVVMPGIDGYQVCKLIKSKKTVQRTAVAMLTSKSSPFDKIRGTMAGCDAYLTKPVDEEKLLGVIAKFLPQ
jgi:two-component system, cell cycle response regulator